MTTNDSADSDRRRRKPTRRSPTNPSTRLRENDDAATETETAAETQPEPQAGIVRRWRAVPEPDSAPSCWRPPWSRRQASRRGCTSSSTAPTKKPTRPRPLSRSTRRKTARSRCCRTRPESLDKDFAAAKSHLTGDFLSYYTQFTEQIVTPAAKQKSVKTSAAVVRAAVSELHPDSAVVLVFINQNTTSKENPDGSFAASAVKVGLKKINDTWLIAVVRPRVASAPWRSRSLRTWCCRAGASRASVWSGPSSR